MFQPREIPASSFMDGGAFAQCVYRRKRHLGSKPPRQNDAHAWRFQLIGSDVVFVPELVFRHPLDRNAWIISSQYFLLVQDIRDTNTIFTSRSGARPVLPNTSGSYDEGTWGWIKSSNSKIRRLHIFRDGKWVRVRYTGSR